MEIKKAMLAQNWDKQKKKIEYPCIIQPKLDGIRCLAHRSLDKITFWSRNGKSLENLEHIRDELMHVMPDNAWWDGELYVHGVDFSDVVSWVKRKQDNTRLVHYYVYDVMTSHPYSDRMLKLPKYGDNVSPVIGEVCTNERDVDEWHDRFVKGGYEGSMIRNLEGGYKHGRSMDLQKRKDWFDEEYLITEVVEGKGKFKECAIFICLGPNKTFAVTSPGTIEQKKQYWSHRYLYVGKKVTVKYQEKTKTGIPRFPIAVSLRDYE